MAHLSRPKQIPAKIVLNVCGWFEWDQEHLATLSSQKSISRLQQPDEDQQEKIFWKDCGRQDSLTKLRVYMKI